MDNPERFDMVENKQTLTLYETKTEYMLIGSTKRLKQIENDPVIKIEDHVIRRLYSKKVVGLEIDDQFKWTKYVVTQSKNYLVL